MVAIVSNGCRPVTRKLTLAMYETSLGPYMRLANRYLPHFRAIAHVNDHVWKIEEIVPLLA